jgi:hypothetical protein
MTAQQARPGRTGEIAVDTPEGLNYPFSTSENFRPQDRIQAVRGGTFSTTFQTGPGGRNRLPGKGGPRRTGR